MQDMVEGLKLQCSSIQKMIRKNTYVDEAQAIAAMMEKCKVVLDMYHCFDYVSAMNATPQQHLAMV